MSAQLKDHIVLVTGALGTLGTAMCKAIEAAGGKPLAHQLGEPRLQEFQQIQVGVELHDHA
jgi:NADP-dependent 3-hydroxy acid dehydrogenase YdfG